MSSKGRWRRRRAAEVAALGAGIEALDAGREKPLTQYVAEQQARGRLALEVLPAVVVCEVAPGLFVTMPRSPRRRTARAGR